MNPDRSQPPDTANHLKSHAVRVGNDLNGNYGVGTAFLGRRDGRVALYTAAHNLQGAQVRGRVLRIDDWHWLAPTIDVHLGAFHRKLEVFTMETPAPVASTNRRAPTFRWLRHGPHEMVDAVRFDLSPKSPLLRACMDRFTVVDLDDPVPANELTERDRLTWVGFPGGDAALTNQAESHDPAHLRSARFVGVRDGHIQADNKAEAGFSGGPVFTDGGRFAGMVAGRDFGWDAGSYYDRARIITAQDFTLL